MQLDSVRELKAEVRGRLAAQVSATAVTDPLTDPATVALGVLPRPRGFGLAVRVSSADALELPSLAAVLDRWSAETDVRVVGAVRASSTPLAPPAAGRPRGGPPGARGGRAHPPPPARPPQRRPPPPRGRRRLRMRGGGGPHGADDPHVGLGAPAVEHRLERLERQRVGGRDADGQREAARPRQDAERDGRRRRLRRGAHLRGEPPPDLRLELPDRVELHVFLLVVCR